MIVPGNGGGRGGASNVKGVVTDGLLRPPQAF